MSFSHQISELKKQLGNRILITGHHYQSDSIIQHCDIIGDSLELARKVAQENAPHIIFCGVYFMAESAALLARQGQSVHMPDTEANCVMSQQAPADLARRVLQRLCAKGRKIIPLAYVNTSVSLKAVVGEFGGAVCTSANAQVMLDWALRQGDGVLFLPDRHLGRNTAKKLGLSPQDWRILSITLQGMEQESSRNDVPLLLWPGCCAIHAKIRHQHIAAIRSQYPDCRIAVHPECSPEVVDHVDAAGSTSFLIEYARQAAPGETIIIGTENNLVERLRKRHETHCTILPLRAVSCSHMGKTTEAKLLQLLEDISQDKAPVISIAAEQAQHAKNSLTRMLDVCAKASV